MWVRIEFDRSRTPTCCYAQIEMKRFSLERNRTQKFVHIISIVYIWNIFDSVNILVYASAITNSISSF